MFPKHVGDVGGFRCSQGETLYFAEGFEESHG